MHMNLQRVHKLIFQNLESDWILSDWQELVHVNT